MLHRPSLKSDNSEDRLANVHCHEAAKTIASLLKKYRQIYDNRVVDFMLVHAAFNAALVYLVLLDSPGVATYHASMRGLKDLAYTIRWMMPRSEYAQTAYMDLKAFAQAWCISPANSPMFWEDSNSVLFDG
jgi:hypothetical protein